MSWNYDPSNINNDTPEGKRNAVRLLIGDNDSTDQQLQDEEVDFALEQSGSNIYYASSWLAYSLASKFSRMVSTDLDGALSAEYSDLSEKYFKLASSLRLQGIRSGGSSTMGVGFGGITISDLELAREDSNRIKPSFRRDRFRPEGNEYYKTDWSEE